MSTVKVERAESVESTCPVCHDPYEVYAIGPCDHPVCFRCSTRMRVLCEQNDCPICRSIMPQVAFVYAKKSFKDISLRECIPNRKYKIFFQDEDIEDRYLDLLEYRCKLCHDRKPDKTFSQLQTHMRRDHQLFACDLCVNHLKIFPFERKFYSRKDLATHRRVGDPDDKSYKGHPLCEFCDTRFNDKDELMKHLRKDHYYCHFCDQHGSNAYYDQYEDLMHHFSDSHYLCTEGECANPATRFTHAFASEIDLKAHKAAEHNKNLSKAQVREARTIEVDFQLAPRRQTHGRGPGGSSHGHEDSRSGNGGRRGGDRYNRRRDREDEDLQRAIEASKVSAAEARPPVQERLPDPVHDFPTLSGAPAPVPDPSLIQPAKAISKEEEFPTLSSAAKGGKTQQQQPTKAYASVMNFQQEVKPAAPVKKESKPVSLGSVPSVSRDRWSASVPKNSDEEYPALGGSRPSSSGSHPPNVTTVNWKNSAVQNSISGGGGKMQSSQVNQAPRSRPTALSDKTINDVNEFPTLGGSRNQTVRNTLLSEWSKPQNGKKKPVPKSQKFDDSFELPENYLPSSQEKPVIDNSNREDLSHTLANDSANLSLDIKVTNRVHDFPELPYRPAKGEGGGGSAVEKKKKKKKKNDSEKPGGQSKSKSSMDDPSASLNDIALGLLQDGRSTPDSAQQNGGSNNGNSRKSPKQQSVSGQKTSQKTDWFDNPPIEGLSSNGLASEESSGTTDKANKSSEKPIENEVGNFPSLHAMSTPVQHPKPPPGFSSEPSVATSKILALSAPPGFSTRPSSSRAVAPPPPGFPANAVYSEPPNFKARNLQLIQDIRTALDTVQDGFINFRALSTEFRQGMLEASDYYDNCQLLMGHADFSKVFPELMALLPDIGKQRELFEVHQAVNKFGSSGSNILSPCLKCGQVVLVRDTDQHQQLHGMNFADFPSLGGVTTKSEVGATLNGNGGKMSLKGAWIKAK